MKWILSGISDVGSDYEVLRIAEAIEALIGWDTSIVSVPADSLEQTA